MDYRREAGVAVERLGHSALVQPVEEGRAELGAARRAKADRLGVAGLERHAVVLDPRREVQEVSRVCNDGLVVELPTA